VPGPALVTGAAGFAGSHLVDQLLEQHGTVAGWSHLGGRATAHTGDARIQWNAVDLLDRPAVSRALSDLQPQAIYHCAGIAHVGESWSQPVRALSVNVLGTHHVLEGVRDAHLDCPILVTGSALVYRPSTDLLHEEDPVAPADPYGVSKLAQEMLACSCRHAPVFVVRPFNHAGPRQAPTYSTSSFARQIAEIEKGQREPVLHVGNLESRRDVTDVRDTVRAYQCVLEHGQTRRPYNVCSGLAYRVRDLLDILIAQSAVPIEVRIDPSRLRPSDNPVIAGDRSRITAETGWAPEIAIERTLADLLDYWRRRTSPHP
jgi:GDP-4-dehydro-6-deoxy-D-mannose reductase